MSKLGTKLIEVIEQHHSILKNNIIPQSQQYSKILTEFHQKQAKQFQQIAKQLVNAIYHFKQKIDQCQTNIVDIDTQWEKMKRIANTQKGYLHAKQQQIISKVKNMDTVATGIKETVSKIKPKKIAKLPVLKNKCLENMFKTIYHILYHEQQSSFEWKTFKKLALKHEQGEDFIFRLISLNFKQLTKDQYEQLLMLKNDPQFQNTCVNTQYAYDIIDIADWIEYICVGYQFSQQKKASEKQYEKIRKDMAKRSGGGSFQMSKHFWIQSLNQNNQYQTKLQSLQAQIKTLTIGAQSSIQTIKQAEQWRNQQINKLNNLFL